MVRIVKDSENNEVDFVPADADVLGGPFIGRLQERPFLCLDVADPFVIRVQLGEFAFEVRFTLLECL